MPGYDRNRFIDLPESLVDHLKCSMCLAIYENAVFADCGHSFCKDCIYENLKNQLTNCAQCKVRFTRKREYPNCSNVFIGQFVFKHNLTANAIINELRIKCDFESKGCPDVVRLGSLKDHLKVCKFNICQHCNLKQGNPVGHSCLALLKKDRLRLKTKLNKMRVSFNKIHSLNVSLIEENEIFKLPKYTRLNDVIFQTHSEVIAVNPVNKDTNKTLLCKHLRIGTCQCQIHLVHLNSNDITLASLSLDRDHGTELKYDVIIKFIEIQELIFCTNEKHPIIMIKPTTGLCHKIKQALNIWQCLGTTAESSNNFDVNSKGQAHCYITAMFYTTNDEEFKILMFYLFEKSKKYQDIKFRAMNLYKIYDLLTQYKSNNIDFC